MQDSICNTTWELQYLLMQYVLTKMGAVFQAFVNEIFRDILNQCVIVYIDNILICLKTMKTHVSQVCQVLMITETQPVCQGRRNASFTDTQSCFHNQQLHRNSGILHLCSFFSRKPTPAGAKYNVKKRGSCYLQWRH